MAAENPIRIPIRIPFFILVGFDFVEILLYSNVQNFLDLDNDGGGKQYLGYQAIEYPEIVIKGG